MNRQDDTGAAHSDASPGAQSKRQGRFPVGLARAFGGALLFALPLLMTMEMWTLGFCIAPLRLALFLLLALPLLAGLSWYSGFEPAEGLKEDVVDAFVAYAVGFCASAVLLYLFAILDGEVSTEGIIGMVSMQAVPASIGALLAQSQFGIDREEEERKKKESGYWGELFLMIVGSLFLALNVAPTEEIILIGYKMTIWHAVALAAVSLLVMHAFVYSMQFRGQALIPPDASFGSIFLRFTVVGYAIALLISLYILWTFGRTDGTSIEQNLVNVIVLAFPATIGAAAARLIL